MKHHHLFGPVPSRRLGVSLGVDLIPHKTCTLDCVYCECGSTTKLTGKRDEYIPVNRVIEELSNYLSGKPPLDYITFAGSGEPTLNSGLGRVIAFLENEFPQYKTCLLTNGTLFTDPALRREVLPLDLIIPSLDAATEEVFRKVNRPEHSLNLAEIIEGLIKLRQEYRGEIVVEVFIVPGLNDTSAELRALRKILRQIKPERVELGTLDRPGSEEWVEPAPEKDLLEIAAYLDQAQLISTYRPRHKIASFNESISGQIIQTLTRRPCTAADLEQIVNTHQAELQKYLSQLLADERIVAEHRQRGVFYRLKQN